MPLIKCRDLSFGYDGKAVASGISFEVNPGDYLCVVGENGSGKTTLMKTILGLVPPMSGRIETDGLVRNEIGYLPQQAAAREDFPASVREVVRSGALNRRGLRPFYGAAEKRIADRNMEKLGIAALAKSCYRELSGGQQRRVLLARALCAARRLFIADEPTAGLDPKAASEMYDLTQQLNGEGMTVVMISHDVGAALKYATHILHIGERRSLFCGMAGDYINIGPGCALAAGGESA